MINTELNATDVDLNVMYSHYPIYAIVRDRAQ